MTKRIRHSGEHYARLRIEAGELARAGWKQGEIARKLQLARSTVRDWARADGWRVSDLALPCEQGALRPASPEMAARSAREAAVRAADAGDLETARKALAEAARYERLARDLEAARQLALPVCGIEQMTDEELRAHIRKWIPD